MTPRDLGWQMSMLKKKLSRCYRARQESTHGYYKVPSRPGIASILYHLATSISFDISYPCVLSTIPDLDCIRYCPILYTIFEDVDTLCRWSFKLRNFTGRRLVGYYRPLTFIVQGRLNALQSHITQ